MSWEACVERLARRAIKSRAVSGSGLELGREQGGEHQVAPLELFFDLIFVFAITQVTSLLAHDPTWRGLLLKGENSTQGGGR